MSEKQFTTTDEITNIHNLCKEFNLNPKHQAVLLVSLSKENIESDQNQLLCSLQGSSKTIQLALVTSMLQDENLLHIIKNAVTSAMFNKILDSGSEDDDSE
jgi:hypothetical protein